MNFYSTDYNKILEEERKNLEGVRTEQQDIINKTNDELVKNTKNIYDNKVKEKEIEYESNYERNAVQKLINEKAIAEKNANLGLTDSGLNRTQQTAVQMSYANQKGALDIAKQGTLDELSQNLALSLSSIEQNRVSSLADLDANIEAQAQSNAINRYNANIEANAELYESMLNAQKLSGSEIYSGENEEKLIYVFSGYDAQKDKNVYYMNGKEYYFDVGINPYTGDNNRKTYAAEYNDKDIGFFSNGYQPRGLVSEGGAFERATDDKGNYLYTNITGKKQTIWKSPSGKYFVWYGDENQYFEVKP